MKRMLLAAAAALASGCGGDPGAAPAARHFDTVSVHHAGCAGDCPDYTATIDRLGTIRYRGAANVSTAAADRQLAPADLRLLDSIVAQARLADVARRSAADGRPRGCQPEQPGAAVVILAVAREDWRHEARIDAGCAGSEDAATVRWVADSVEHFAQVAADVYGPTP